MKPIFIEFSMDVESHIIDRLKRLYTVTFEEQDIYTNAYYTDEPPLDKIVSENDLIWMHSVVRRESQYAVDGFIRKFFENKVKGKTVVNTTGYLLNYFRDQWAQEYPDHMKGAEYKYNSIQTDDERITKWEILKWVLDNNTIVDIDYDNDESYDLHVITMEKVSPKYDKREGEERMTPVIGEVYLKGEFR